MKIITKIGLALSLLFFVLGLGSLMASLALGATWQMFVTAIDQGEFAIITNHTLPRPIRMGKTAPSRTDSSRQYYSDVEALDIQLGKGVLNIEETREDEISVEILSDTSHVIQTNLDDGTLKITGASKTAEDTIKVRIYIPEGEYFDEARLNVGAATVNVENLEAEELEIKLGAGIFTSTGEILSEESNWEIGVGTLDLNFLECEDTQIDCGMGTVSLTMSDSQEDYDYKVDCGAGAITIGDDSFSLGHHNVSNDDADGEIDIKCGMGTVDLLFNQD